MEPATRIISLLNGLSSAADKLGRSVHSVKQWRRPKDKGGTNGHIPREHQFEVHCLLLKSGVPITAEEIIYSPEQRELIDQLQNQANSKKIKATNAAIGQRGMS